MDAEPRDLRRRVDENPADELAAREYVAARVRAGFAADLPIVLLPWRDRYATVAVVGEVAVPFVEHPFDLDSRAVRDGERVAGFVGRERRSVSVRDARSGQELPGSPFAIPDDFDARAVFLYRECLYVGGRGVRADSSLVLLARPVRADADWTRATTAPVVTHEGRAVEAFALVRPFNDDRLLGFTSGRQPRHYAIHTLARPEAPSHVGTNALPWHAREERVVAVATNASWHAVLTESPDDSSFLSLVSQAVSQGHERWVVESRGGRWRDAVLLGDAVVIAAGAAGVGVLRLPSPEPRLPGRSLRAPDGRSEAPRLDPANVRRVSMRLEEGEVVLRLGAVTGLMDAVVAAIAAPGREPVTRLAVVAVS